MPRFCSCCSGDEDGVMFGDEHFSSDPPLHTTLTEYFKSQIKSNHISVKKPAVIFSPASYTFGELDHYSTAVAREIQKHLGDSFVVANPDEEILIAVCLPLSERIIPLIFAILKTGAAFLPLDPSYPEDLLLTIINKFRPLMVITDDDGPILGKYDAKQFAELSKLMSIEEIWLDMKVPENFDQKQQQQQQQQSQPQPTITITTTTTKDALPPGSGSGSGSAPAPSSQNPNPQGKPRLDNSTKEVELLDTPLHTPAHERPCLVVHTTGIGGNPRGVRISHTLIINRLQWEWRTLPYRKNSVAALTSPISSIDAFIQIFSSLLKGVTLHIFRKSEVITMNMTNFIHKLAERKITRLHFQPSVIASFLKGCESLGKESPELENIKYVCCIGGSMTLELARRFANFFMKGTLLVCFSGSVETGDIFYSLIRGERDVEKKSLMGRLLFEKVMDNCIIYVLSNYLELMKDGAQGEICVAGPVALGYVDMKEEEGENRFVDNPHDDRKNYRKLFRTGEYGRLLVGKNGRRSLYLEGRIDSQVKVKGYDVLMDELGDILMHCEKEVEEAHMLCYHPDQLDQTVVGFVLPRRNVRQTLMAEEVKGKLSSRIPEYLIPEIKIIEEIPVVGKGQRVCSQKLIRMYEEEDRTSNFNNWGKVRLTNEKLACCKLLLEALYKFANIPIEQSVEAIEKSASFYQLGGTSLNTMSVVIYLNKKDCPVNIREFVMAKNIMEIVELMAQRIGKTREFLENHGLIQLFTDRDVREDFEIEIVSAKDPAQQKEAASLLSKAYVEKDILSRYNLLQYDDFYEFLMEVWESYVEQNLSTIIKRKKDDKIVACCMCQDFYTPTPELAKGKTLFHLLEYYQELKGSVFQENVVVTQMMLNENIRLTKTDGFTSLYCAATNPLIRDLCVDVLNFKILDDYPPKLFQESPDFHPFRAVPSSISTVLCWLVVGVIPSKISSIDQSIVSALLEKSETHLNPNDKKLKEKEKGKDKDKRK